MLRNRIRVGFVSIVRGVGSQRRAVGMSVVGDESAGCRVVRGDSGECRHACV